MSSKNPEVLSEAAPVAAPLIGRPTRPYARHLTCRLRSKREAEEVKMAYILAQTRMVIVPELDDTPTEKQVAYAHRSAITAAVTDLFGSISGAPVLAFDILRCSKERNEEAKVLMEVKEEQDKVDSMVTHRFDLLIGLQRRYVDEMVSALSMITAGFCGGEILSLFMSPKASPEARASARLLVDVLGVSDSPTSLLSAC